jgi:hypothetical protein
MSSANWKAVGIAGTLLGAIVVLHGISSRRWRQLHTAAALLTVASVLGPRLVR